MTPMGPRMAFVALHKSRKRWLSFDSLRRRGGSHMLHQAQGVEVHPLLNYLTPVESVNLDSHSRHSFASRSNAHPSYALMRAAQREVDCDLVLFREHGLYRKLDVWIGSEGSFKELFKAFRSHRIGEGRSVDRRSWGRQALLLRSCTPLEKDSRISGERCLCFLLPTRLAPQSLTLLMSRLPTLLRQLYLGQKQTERLTGVPLFTGLPRKEFLGNSKTGGLCIKNAPAC
jgi:hypothetical protein